MLKIRHLSPTFVLMVHIVVMCTVLLTSPLVRLPAAQDTIFSKKSTRQQQDANTSPFLSQYILKNWSGDNGLPSAGITTSLQTSNGYLWFSTLNGLVRFNGKTFTIFNQSNTKEIRSSVFSQMCEDKQGNVWIATNGSGLLRYRNGKFTAFTPQNTPLLNTTFIESLCLDSAGKLWIGTDKGLLYATPSEGFSLNGTPAFHEMQEFRGIPVLAIHQDAHSVLWLSTQNNGLYRIDNRNNNQIIEHLEAVLPLISENKVLYDVVETPDSTIWIAAVEKGVLRYQYSTKQFSLFTGANDINIFGNVYSLGVDKRGTLWIGSDRGLYRYEHGVLSGLTTERKLHNAKFYEDREGNLWFSTYRRGLSMLRQGKFSMFGMPEGLREDIAHCIKLSTDGGIWIGTENGLHLLRGKTIQFFSKESGVLPNNTVRDVFEDNKHTVWIGTHGGLIEMRNHVTVRTYTTNDGLSNNQIRSILQDKQGNYWFGTLRGLTFLSSAPELQKKSFRQRVRIYLPNVFVSALFEARDSSIYVSTVGDGFYVLHPDGTQRHYTTKDGFLSQTATRMLEEADGTMWIASNMGISKLYRGALRNYDAKDGLPNYNVYQIIADSIGNFWCATSNGIVKIARKDFDDVDAHKIPKLRVTIYKKADGLRENECTGNGHGCTDANGNLWFATSGGAAKISPNNIQQNTLPPPVFIEGIGTDEQYRALDTMSAAEPLSISPDTRTISFSFAALSYTAPDNVRFRVKLEGFDTSWHETDKIQVFYTNLPRGKKYIFRVTACNNDGVWNESGAALEFSCAPYFWETWWFYAFWILLGMLTIYQTVQWRIRRLQKKAKHLQQTIQERTSELQIANDEISRQMSFLDERSRDVELANSQLQQSYDNLSLLIEIGQSITSSLDLQVIGNRIYENLNTLVDAPVLVICLHNTEQHELHYALILEKGELIPPVTVSMRREELPAVQCVLQCKEIILQEGDIEVVTGSKVHSLVYMPLIVEEYVIGAFSVQSYNNNAFSPYDINIMRTIAPHIAAALSNTKTYEKVENALAELRRAQTQLVQAEKMASLGTLVAGVAHELNTPIGVAVTAASTLDVRTKEFVKRYTEGGLKKSELDAYVQTAQTGADLTLRNLERAANLIQSFKQVAVDQTRDEARQFKLGAYLQEIVTSLQPMIKTSKHRIEIDYREEIEMESYPGAISQIITNLVQNSIKHGFEGYREDGVMTIAVKCTNNQVTILYADNGRGIPQEVLPRIFDPFFTTKPGEQGGTGLGLNIVYNLVTQKLAGTVRCESVPKTRTSFIIQLHVTEKV